jgi:hypothetical protein
MVLKLIIKLKTSHLLVPTIKKHNSSFRLVQDLRKINAIVNTIYPVFLNPYTILSLIPPQTSFFLVLHLKDAFLRIPLHPSCQPLFAFMWKDPITHHSQKLPWTVLPQRHPPPFLARP